MVYDMRLSVHHIGGRAGSRAFPILKAFEKDIINVLYEADSECIEQIRERNAELSSELHVLPYCLGASCTEGVINITYDPYTSSLYELSPEYSSYYSIGGGFDYLLSEACKVVEKRRVKIISADDLFRSKDNSVPPPDFLSIDTEGSEYDILSGARETLRSNVLGLVIEADFHPVFKGQKIFGDTVKLLNDAGFNFTRFLNTHEMFQFRVPVGLRGEGVHGTSDALFLRKLETLDSVSDSIKQRNMLRKLAFIAIVFRQLDYAVECLRRSKCLTVCNQAVEGDKLAYLRFLQDLEREIQKMPVMYPLTFTEKYTSFSASKARFEHSDAQKRQELKKLSVLYRIKQLVKKQEVIYGVLQWLMKSMRIFKNYLVFSKKRMCAGHTSVERLLLKYGLKEQADILKKKRIFQS